jgi:uncharacterized protein (TIGR02449 family)
MDELLQQLELRIKSFMQRYQKLEETNTGLVHNQTLILREKASLLAKNEAAIAQIEHIVSRLKASENLSHD